MNMRGWVNGWPNASPGLTSRSFWITSSVARKSLQRTALPEPVCGDPDDDKFLACALAARADLIVSGGKKLLAVSGYEDVAVITPREFSDRWL